MEKEEAKFYCIVEYSTGEGMISRLEIFSKDDLETIDGIDKVGNFVKKYHNAKTAMIIFIQKLKTNP